MVLPLKVTVDGKEEEIVLTTNLCMMAQNRKETVVPNLTRAAPFFDRLILIDGGSEDGTLEELQGVSNLHIVHSPWSDDFPHQRQKYLNKVGELRQPNEIAIVAVSDDDEWYSEPLMQYLPGLMVQAMNAGFNQLGVRCRSVWTDRNGNRVDETLDEWRKPLIFVWEPNIHYADTKVHEDLMIPSGVRFAGLQDYAGTDHEILYEHIKQENIIWPRGCRNFFIGGGGPNLWDRQPLWKPFRALVEKHTGATTWKDFEQHLKAGDIHPNIKSWMIDNRFIGTDHDTGPNKDLRWPKHPDGASEVRECFLAYFLWYGHIDELPEEIIEQDKPVIDYQHEYAKIHGGV